MSFPTNEDWLRTNNLKREFDELEEYVEGDLYRITDKLNQKFEKEIKELKETLALIERFLGDEYAKLKKEESQLLEKDE